MTSVVRYVAIECLVKPFHVGGRLARNEHPDHPVLPRRDEELSVPAAADEQIRASDGRADRVLDELAQRHVGPLAACIPHVELNLFDRRHRLGNPIIRLLHRRKIGGEQTAAQDVAEHELAAKRGDAAVVRRNRR